MTRPNTGIGRRGNVRNAGVGGAAPTPLTILGSALTHWWKPGAGTTIVTTEFQAWADVIGGASAAGTAAEYPTVGVDALNRSVPVFGAGADLDGLTDAAHPAHSYDGTGGIIGCVFELVANAANKVYFGSMNSVTTTPNHWGIFSDSSEQLRVLVGGTTTAPINFTDTGNVMSAGLHSVILRHGTDLLASSNDFEIYLDGALRTAGNYAAAPAGTTSRNIKIGAVANGTGTLRPGGRVCDCIIATGVGTDAQIASLHSYFARVRGA